MGSSVHTAIRPAARRDGDAAAVATPHVTARQFSVFYGRHEAVRQVTFDVPKGQVTAIIGPSGCGKSTFLRAVNRMNDLIPGCAARGQLIFDGQNIYGPQVDVVALRQRIGMVFQKPNPFPKTVFDNVAYGPRLRGVRRRGEMLEIVERSLTRAALWDEVKDRLHDNALRLSGGQQQRLCIARALAVDPEILLLARPSTGFPDPPPGRAQCTGAAAARRTGAARCHANDP